MSDPRCSCGGPLPYPQKAPSSPVETTDAPARPIPPEALNGLTGAAYTAVIRREADECAHTALSLIYRNQRDEARCQFDAVLAVNRELTADVERIKGGREIERTMIRNAVDQLAAKDATIERLWAQLNEATNVPDDRCQGCSDEHCTATT